MDHGRSNDVLGINKTVDLRRKRFAAPLLGWPEAIRAPANRQVRQLKETGVVVHSTAEANKHRLAVAVVSTAQKLPVAIVVVAYAQDWGQVVADVLTEEDSGVDGIREWPVREPMLMVGH